MRFPLLSLLLLSSVHAHTTLTAVVINGQVSNRCVRPVVLGYETFPCQSGDLFTAGIYSSNYSCGFMPAAAQEAPETCVANAGDTIMLGWSNRIEQENYPILGDNHKGPIIVYMSRYNHGNGGLPQGNSWFKIFEIALTRPVTADEQWDKTPWAAPYTLWANQGRVTLFPEGPSWATGTYAFGGINVKIPSDLPAGDYLIRTEIIALHANTPSSGPHGQSYVGCAQIRLASGGNGNPTDLVAFPGGHSLNDKAFSYIVWRDQVTVPYPFPGPPVYVGSAVTPVPVTPPTPISPPPSTPNTPEDPPFSGAPSMLKSDAVLRQLQSLVDPSGKYLLILQNDGNLCIYNTAYEAQWCSGSGDGKWQGTYVLLIQNGNMIIYQSKPQWSPIWSTSTSGGKEPYYLSLQTDRNLILMDSDSQTLWSAGSGINVQNGGSYNPFHNTSGSSQFNNASAPDPFAISEMNSSYSVGINVLVILLSVIALLI